MTLFSHIIAISSLAMMSLTASATPLNDPTTPANVQSTTQNNPPATAKAVEWQLNTTVIDPYQEIAVINGVQVAVGEQINGATVVSISHEQVELLKEEQLIILSLEQSFISQLKPKKIEASATKNLAK